VLAQRGWASVGIISQANAHPLNSEEDGGRGGALRRRRTERRTVDNFADLKASGGPAHRGRDHHRRQGHPHPALAPAARWHRADRGVPRDGVLVRGERGHRCQRRFGATTSCCSRWRGSGQALYGRPGRGPPTSSPASLTAWSRRPSHYIRLDGETPANLDNPTASRGQVVRLDASRAGTLAGIERIAYDGTVLAGERRRPHDRADHDPRHRPWALPATTLLKEINEAPASFRKTLRGKLVEGGRGTPRCRARLTRRCRPPCAMRSRAAARSAASVAIGQGTAHVAGSELRGRAQRDGAGPSGARRCRARHPSSLVSGCATTCATRSWSPSASRGTTTDTNRTVDVVRAPRRARHRDRQPS